MVATLLFTSLLVRPATDPWDLKPNLEAGKKITYSVSATASGGGNEVHATFDHSLTPEKAGEDGTRKVKFNWDNLELNESPNDAPGDFEALLAPDGTIKEATTPRDDEYRRFLSVFAFVYPSKPVAVGDKWTAESVPAAKDAKKMTYTFEVKEVTKVKDQELLRVTSTQKEDGENLTQSDGTWWLSRDGSIVKFSLDIKRWTIPFAGPVPMDVNLKAERK